MKKTFASVIVLTFILTVATKASVVPVTGITGHDGGNWPSWYGHLTDMINGSNPSVLDPGDGPTPGMDTSTDPTDPSTWTWSGGWHETWHANSVLSDATNNKIGWAVLDFGNVVSNLENAYLWISGGATVYGGNGNGELVKDYNLYYSSGVGIDTLPGMPQSKGTTGDYNFGNGDWTQIDGTHTLPDNIANSAQNALPSNTIPLNGVSAQYVGIEILSLYDPTKTRLAIGQIEITQGEVIPEPASFLLLGLCGLTLMFRRR